MGLCSLLLLHMAVSSVFKISLHSDSGCTSRKSPSKYRGSWDVVGRFV